MKDQMDWTLCPQASLSTRLVLTQSRGRNGMQDVNTLYGLRHRMTTHCMTKLHFSISTIQFTPGFQLQEYLNETPPQPLGASWQVQLFVNFPPAGHGLWDSDRLAMATFRRCFLDVPQLQISERLKLLDEWQVKRCKERLEPEGEDWCVHECWFWGRTQQQLQDIVGVVLVWQIHLFCLIFCLASCESWCCSLTGTEFILAKFFYRRSILNMNAPNKKTSKSVEIILDLFGSIWMNHSDLLQWSLEVLTPHPKMDPKWCWRIGEIG